MTSFFAWGLLTALLFGAAVLLQMRFGDRLAKRTGRGITSDELIDRARGDLLGGFGESVRQFGPRMGNLLNECGYPDLNLERRVAVALCVIAVLTLCFPFTYIYALHAKPFGPPAIYGAAAVNIGLFVAVTSLLELFARRRTSGQRRLGALAGVFGGVGIILLWLLV